MQPWKGLNPEWTELRMGDFSTLNSSQPRMAHNFNSNKKIVFDSRVNIYIIVFEYLENE
jgi:hypothetical protein